jgi:hypothetical protein
MELQLENKGPSPLITAQCRSKGMITPSVVRAVWKQWYTLQKQKIWASFHITRQLHLQRLMNKQSGFNAEQIEKDKYPESKNRLKIKSKIMGKHSNTNTVGLTNQQVITREDYISLKVLHSLHRLTLGC